MALIDRLPIRLRPQADALIAEARDRQRRRRNRLVLLAAIVIAGIVIGYGISQMARAASDTAAKATRPLPNPCTLLTDGQVAAALGTSSVQFRTPQLIPGMKATASQARMCTWHGTPLNESVYNASQLVVMVTHSTRKQFVHSWRNDIPVAGVGQLAYADTGPARLLEVYAHGYAFELQIQAANPIEVEKHLAKLALAHLH